MNRKIVAAAQKGDGKATTILFESVQNDAYKIAYSYLGNEYDSMDAVCTSIEKAILSLRKLRQPKYFKTWFIRIVINESKHILNSRKKDYLYTGDMIQCKNENNVESVDNKVDIERGMLQLADDIRHIISLKYYLELTFKEIADVLELPESTVKSKLYKGLADLKKLLK